MVNALEIKEETKGQGKRTIKGNGSGGG